MSTAAYRFLFALVILLGCRSTLAAAPEDACGERTLRAGTVFTLTISRSFEPDVTFKLCDREDKSKRFLLISTQSSSPSDKWTSRSVPLESLAYDRVASLYELSLDYDVRIDVGGNDGSTWCLETQRGFTYSKACFWTPADEPERRNLIGLLELGKELWRIAKFDSSKLN
jgi:hypothetical protein